jgi:type III secretory pathway lipoprotein EscJ
MIMKKILILFLAILWLSACSPHMYSTTSFGKDNSSFIVVLTDGQEYNNVSVIVDGKAFPIETVYKVKASRKAHPVITSPGKHKVEVVSAGKTLVEENIFIGLQETKKIVLK